MWYGSHLPQRVGTSSVAAKWHTVPTLMFANTPHGHSTGDTPYPMRMYPFLMICAMQEPMMLLRSA